MLNSKNRFKNYKRHGYKSEYKVRLDNFRRECQDAVEIAKVNYLTNMGNKLNNPNTSRKSYCIIIYKVMDKCKTFEKINFNNLFEHLTTHYLISKTNLDFDLRIDLANNIQHASDSTKSLEVCAIFLDKAFDKV